jgi:hypothetical protein
MILFPNGYEKENKPILAGQTKALADNTVATSENASYPAINMVNPNENQRWESSTSSEQYITVTLSQDEYIDYIAFAGHNFGDDDFDLSVETFDGSTWVERLEPQPLTNNKPAILKIDPVLCSGVRLKIGASDTTPTISVLYAGLSVELERNIYVGHTPIPYGKTSNVVNGMSESGRFLGRIVIGENYNTDIELNNITPSFFRTKVNPFFIDAEEKPFFFAWRPKDYNDEVGFAWFRQNGSMTNQLSNGFVNISFPISAVVDGREITTEQPTERFITISADVDDLNLRTLYDTLFPTPLDTTTLNVTVNSGVTIGATSTANAALDVGTWPSGTTINIDLAGTIQGAGGAGGDAPDGAGLDGGDAIIAARAITIDLASGGSIIDGAGGGGADLTNGGGGGAGSVAGVGGAADGGTAGNAGNATTGGTASGNAGSGGDAGLIGADSDILDGGSSGCTIDDNPLITVVNSGSGIIEGCNVNSPDFGSTVIDVTTDQVDFNLRTAYDNAGNPTPTASTNLTCFVRNGVTISASDTATPAFDIGTWPVGATIILNVNGTIVGAGGAGGNAVDGVGSNGGNALVTTTAISIDFADQGSGADGLIASGGGGGQAGTNGGGGGGAGNVIGVGGNAAATSLDGGHSTGTAGGAGFLYLDRSFTIPNGSTVTSIGVDSPNSGSMKVKIAKRNSAGNYDIVYDESVTHGGSGLEDFTLTTPFEIPETGDYHLADFASFSRNRSSTSENRATNAGDLTGTGQTLSESSGNVSLLSCEYFTTSLIGSDGTSTTGGSGNTSTTETQIPQGTGTAIGNLTETGGLAAAFDGVDSQSYTATANRSATNNSSYIGKTYSPARSVSKMDVHSANDFGYTSGGGNGSLITMNLRGKNGTAPSSSTDGTLLGTVSRTETDAYHIDTAVSSDSTTTYDHIFLEINTSETSAVTLRVGEVKFYENVITQDSGDGGDLGQDGEDNSQVQGALGSGSAGNAIDGVSFVTKLNSGDGTITGPEVN